MSEFIKQYRLNVRHIDALIKYAVYDGDAPRELTDAERAEFVRAKRDLMLKDSDFAVLPDSPVPEGRKEKWIAYRRYLRDVPQQSGKWWTAGVMSFDEWSAGDD
mgnify:FL=1